MTVGQAFRPVINQAGWKACSEGKKKMVLDSNKKCYNNKAPVKKMRLVSPVTESLPPYNDIPALARYWKQHYNTPEGKGTEEEFVKNYQKYIQEVQK